MMNVTRDWSVIRRRAVPVDNARHARRFFHPPADLVRRPPHGDEVAGAQERDRVVVGEALAVERLLEHVRDLRRMRLRHRVTRPERPLRGDRHAATSSPRTNRSSGTWSSCPTSRAISRNVYRPARSRGPKLDRSFSKWRARKPAGYP